MGWAAATSPEHGRTVKPMTLHTIRLVPRLETVGPLCKAPEAPSTMFLTSSRPLSSLVRNSCDAIPPRALWGEGGGRPAELISLFTVGRT